MTGTSEADPLEAAARFVADQPGWIERKLARCVPTANGDCAGCGSYRPVRWPCVQVWIARRAQEILRDRAAGGTTTAPARRQPPETPTPVEQACG